MEEAGGRLLLAIRAGDAAEFHAHWDSYLSVLESQVVAKEGGTDEEEAWWEVDAPRLGATKTVNETEIDTTFDSLLRAACKTPHGPELLTTLVAAAKKTGKSLDSVSDSQGNSLLHLVAGLSANEQSSHSQVKDKATLLLHSQCSVDYLNHFLCTPLITAVSAGNVVVALCLLEANANVENCDTNGDCALHFAVRGGNETMVSVLFGAVPAETQKKILGMQNHSGEMPLALAVSSGAPPGSSIVSTLIELGANPRKVNINSDSIFHLAVRTSQLDLLKELLRGEWATAEVVNAPNEYGVTPLMLAAEHAHVDVVRYLVEVAHADIGAVDEDGWDATYRAVTADQIANLKYLLRCSKENAPRLLLVASHRSSPATVRCLIDNGGVDVAGLEDSDGNGALHLAARFDKPEIVQCLMDTLEGRPDVINCGNHNEVTPLLMATANGHSAVAMTLINNSATDVNKCDSNLRSPLWAVAFDGNLALTKQLMERGAIVATRDINHTTPLMAAVMGGHLEIVKLLVSSGACVTDVDEDGASPLVLAAKEREIFDFFLEMKERCAETLHLVTPAVRKRVLECACAKPVEGAPSTEQLETLPKIVVAKIVCWHRRKEARRVRRLGI